MISVSSENGTAGMPRIGRAPGSSPSSPTSGTSMPATTTATVSATIATSGAGTGSSRAAAVKITARPAGDQGGAEQSAVADVRHLREEDEDRQRVDEAGHHRARDEAHEPRDAQDPRARSGSGPRRSSPPAGTRRRARVTRPTMTSAIAPVAARDHRRAAAGDRDRHGHREGGVQPDLGIDAGDEREGDRLGDERERDDEAGEQLDAQHARGGQRKAARYAHAEGKVRQGGSRRSMGRAAAGVRRCARCAGRRGRGPGPRGRAPGPAVRGADASRCFAEDRGPV